MEGIIRTLVGVITLFILFVAPVAHAQVVNSEVKISAETGNIRIHAGEETQEFFVFAKPSVISIDVTNTGNVALEPTGTVDIKNVFNESLTTVTLNPDLQQIPAGERKMIKGSINTDLPFGRYSAELRMQYGQSEEINKTSAFWVLPWSLLLLGIGGLALLILLTYQLRKIYHRRLLSKHGLHQEDDDLEVKEL